MKYLLRSHKTRLILLAAVLIIVVAVIVFLRVRSNPETVLATIGKHQITTNDFDQELLLHLKSQQLPQVILTMNSEGKRAILEQMITRLLFVEAAQREHIELDREMRLLLQRLEEDKRAEKYIQIRIDEDPITETDMRNFYEAHPEQFNTPEIVRARHIVVANQPLAQELLGQITDGADMRELATMHNIDGTREREGDLGWVRRGIMVEQFEQAAFALAKGEVSSVVTTPFGYHIIKIEDRKQPECIAFEDAKADIYEQLWAQRVKTLEDQLRGQYPACIDENLWKSLMQESAAPEH